MRTVRRSMLVLSSTLAIGGLVGACSPSDKSGERAAAYSSVDINQDCNKPLFDRKAPDGRVILSGMTPSEQEVCFAAGRLGGAK